MRLCLTVLAVLLGPVTSAWAQQDGLLQINDPLHRFLLRQQTLGRLPDAVLSHQPLSAYEARQYLDSLDAGTLSRVDRQLYARFRGTAPGPGVSTFRKVIPFAFRNGRDFISAEGEDFALQVNPLFYLTYGRARQSQRDDREASVPVWQNTRGLRASGHIGKHIFFETRLEENQRRDAWPAFALDTAPRLGSTKFDRDGQFYDYFVATGIAGFRSKHFEVRLGRDRNRWGFGKGSLMLSNFAPVFDQLQIRTTVWRLQYTNLFVKLSDQSPEDLFTSVVPSKYGAFHRLAIRVSNRIQVALFESVIFSSPDSLGLRAGGFELSYLNPIILYRAVESDLVNPDVNPDNVLLGGSFSWVAWPGVRLYTELLIDELKVNQIGKKWWGNKWGWMAGLHLADVPLKNLSLRFEYARLRPYLYSHQSSLSAYIHYNDLLGHPAGPNASDVAFFLDYQPTTRLRAALNLAYTRRGRNTSTQNFGSDPSLSFGTRVSDTDVRLLQGIRQTHLLVEAYLGYELLPDVYLEAAFKAESIDDAETGTDRYVAPFVMLRWGLPFQSLQY
ncbi:MAG: capsule assembly Wzi family protein [Rhodothermales bacterium]